MIASEMIKRLNHNHSARSLKLPFQHITDLHLDHSAPVSHSATHHWFSDGGPCGLRDELSCCSASNEMGSDEWWHTHRGNRCVTGFDTAICRVCECVWMHTSTTLELVIWCTFLQKYTVSSIVKVTEVQCLKDNSGLFKLWSYFILWVVIIIAYMLTKLIAHIWEHHEKQG